MYDDDDDDNEEWFLHNEMTERMFHNSFVSFYIALQYCSCECACICVNCTYSRPYGRRRITSWTSPTHLPLQILGLNAEAKKKKKKKNTAYTNEERNLPPVQFCVFCIDVLTVSSFDDDDDDFTKTVLIIRGHRVLVYR